MKRWRIAGINFDHFHMGDLLRMAHDHPGAEIVGISDEQPERMREAARNFGLSADRVFTDYRECLEKARPEVVLLCPAAARHGEWTEKVAPSGAHLMVEKPFAASLGEADRMVAAAARGGGQLMINWPLAWDAGIRTLKRLIDEEVLGEILEVHYYGGNRGPLWHGADKVEKTAAQVQSEKPHSWFYKRAHGGGSMQDYLGYGTTLGTWFMGGRKPIEVTAVVDEPSGLEVDEQSVVVARYSTALSKFETRWGTFTDPWTLQPQPACGFVVCGREGTASALNYADHVTVQTRAEPKIHALPVDRVEAPFQDPVQYFLRCLEAGERASGPVGVEISRIGQQIVDTAAQSSREKRTLPLIQ